MAASIYLNQNAFGKNKAYLLFTIHFPYLQYSDYNSNPLAERAAQLEVRWILVQYIPNINFFVMLITCAGKKIIIPSDLLMFKYSLKLLNSRNGRF